MSASPQAIRNRALRPQSAGSMITLDTRYASALPSGTVTPGLPACPAPLTTTIAELGPFLSRETAAAGVGAARGAASGVAAAGADPG
jgi:hypothetical protein